jgi:hypothetical protein
VLLAAEHKTEERVCFSTLTPAFTVVKVLLRAIQSSLIANCGEPGVSEVSGGKLLREQKEP